jgi:hypothetical protein
MAVGSELDNDGVPVRESGVGVEFVLTLNQVSILLLYPKSRDVPLAFCGSFVAVALANPQQRIPGFCISFVLNRGSLSISQSGRQADRFSQLPRSRPAVMFWPTSLGTRFSAAVTAVVAEQYIRHTIHTNRLIRWQYRCFLIYIDRLSPAGI